MTVIKEIPVIQGSGPFGIEPLWIGGYRVCGIDKSKETYRLQGLGRCVKWVEKKVRQTFRKRNHCVPILLKTN